MTISELVAKGISKIWRPPWVETSYLELDLSQDKTGKWYYGPWGHVHDTNLDKAASKGEEWAIKLVEANAEHPFFMFQPAEDIDDNNWRPWPLTREERNIIVNKYRDKQ